MSSLTCWGRFLGRRSAWVSLCLTLAFAGFAQASGTGVGTPLSHDVQMHQQAFKGEKRVAALAVNADGLSIVVESNLGDQLTLSLYESDGALMDRRTITANIANYRELSVALDFQGNGLMVWRELDDNATAGPIKGLRFDKSLNSLGSVFEISSKSVASDGPRMSMAADGRFVVAWPTPSGQSNDIAYRLYEPSGKAAGDEHVVKAVGARDGVGDIAMAPDGHFVMLRSLRDRSQLAIQLFNRAGQPTGSFQLVSAPTTIDTYRTSAAIASDGRFVIAWNDGGERAIFMQRYDASGKVDGNPVNVSESSSLDGWEPDIAVDLKGDIGVIWETTDNASARFYRADGSAVTDVVTVTEKVDSDVDLPFISLDADGDIFTAWTYDDRVTEGYISSLVGFENIDIAANLQPSAKSAALSETVTYTLRIDNRHAVEAPITDNTPAAADLNNAIGLATHIAFTFNLPQGGTLLSARLVSGTDANLSCQSQRPQKVTCLLPSALSAGASDQVELAVQMPSSDSRTTASVYVSADQYDDDEGSDNSNNRDSATVVVGEPASSDESDDSSNGGGSGGCVMSNVDEPFDPLLLLLAILSGVIVMARRRAGRAIR